MLTYFSFFYMKMVAWLVAALVMVINGYLLFDFIASEVTGWLFTVGVFAFTTGYVAFIVYLVLRDINVSSLCGSKRSQIQ